jgi:hypothetical protein
MQKTTQATHEFSVNSSYSSLLPLLGPHAKMAGLAGAVFLHRNLQLRLSEELKSKGSVDLMSVLSKSSLEDIPNRFSPPRRQVRDILNHNIKDTGKTAVRFLLDMAPYVLRDHPKEGIRFVAARYVEHTLEMDAKEFKTLIQDARDLAAGRNGRRDAKFMAVEILQRRTGNLGRAQILSTYPESFFTDLDLSNFAHWHTLSQHQGRHFLCLGEFQIFIERQKTTDRGTDWLLRIERDGEKLPLFSKLLSGSHGNIEYLFAENAALGGENGARNKANLQEAVRIVEMLSSPNFAPAAAKAEPESESTSMNP